MRSKSIFSLSALSCALIVTGCSLIQSPVVGDWSGNMTASPQSGGIGAMIGGFATAMVGNAPAELTLKADGTGYLKIPSAPEQIITWKMDGERVLLTLPDSNNNHEATPGSSGVISGSSRTSSPSPNASEGPIIGKLSEDKKTLTFDLGPIQFAMTKQAK
ncbi:MAG: hypothetical protein EON58_21155 [Alphaproteobacteria bacterium]|nr:MAG: hypothetical protein EON58_21155 [Alphaproteobacteria bacterium]